MILTADETRDALHALQRGRRVRRLHDLDWIEVAYKAYIAAILSFGTLFTSAALVGDTSLAPEDGPRPAARRPRGRRAGDRRRDLPRVALRCAGRAARTRTRRRQPRPARPGRSRGRAARLGVPPAARRWRWSGLIGGALAGLARRAAHSRREQQRCRRLDRVRRRNRCRRGARGLGERAGRVRAPVEQARHRRDRRRARSRGR